MSNNFYYTHSANVSSSAVDEVYYNSNASELAVVLHGEVYVYSRVDKARYERLVNAPSVGRDFSNLKTYYGPGRRLSGWDVDFVEVDDSTAPAYINLAGTPKNLTYAADAKVTDNTGNAGNYITLTDTLDTTDVVVLKHAVVFTVNDADAEKVYNVDAAVVAEAVDALRDVANMLGVEVTVRRVVVYFE